MVPLVSGGVGDSHHLQVTNTTKELEKGETPPHEMTNQSAVPQSFPSSSSTSPNYPVNKKKKKRGVSFGSVEVREYPRTVCVNPACADGPPLGIGWEYKNLPVFSVDLYEESRPKTRPKTAYRVSPMDRFRILRQTQYRVSDHDLLVAMTETQAIRSQRRKTLNKIKTGIRVTRYSRMDFIPPKTTAIGVSV